MSFKLIDFSYSLIQKQEVFEIMKCNDFTSNFNLKLTNFQAEELAKTHSLALKENGRIEIGGGIIEKIIKEFCDSPYISMYNYAETLNDLVEIFYFYKNETLELITDDDLIKFMNNAYDGVCQGSLELLAGRELAEMARRLRYGYDDLEKEVEEYDEY